MANHSMHAQLRTVGNVAPGAGLKRILSPPCLGEYVYLVTNLMLRVTSRFPGVMVIGNGIYKGRGCWRGSG